VGPLAAPSSAQPSNALSLMPGMPRTGNSWNFLARNYCAGPLTGNIDAASKQDNPAPSGH
jgi:hypothetical protein